MKFTFNTKFFEIWVNAVNLMTGVQYSTIVNKNWEKSKGRATFSIAATYPLLVCFLMRNQNSSKLFVTSTNFVFQSLKSSKNLAAQKVFEGLKKRPNSFRRGQSGSTHNLETRIAQQNFIRNFRSVAYFSEFGPWETLNWRGCHDDEWLPHFLQLRDSTNVALLGMWRQDIRYLLQPKDLGVQQHLRYRNRRDEFLRVDFHVLFRVDWSHVFLFIRATYRLCFHACWKYHYWFPVVNF